MNKHGKKTVAIVGAGISGLTAGAYILRSGHRVLILEKTSDCGGLVSSFSKDGFLFDTGPRAIGNAGILLPMLEDLGVALPLVKGTVSTGIGSHIVHYDTDDGSDRFILSLQSLFPEAREEIAQIDRRIKSSTKMANTLNKVANPYFRNILKDRKYLFSEFLPWLPSFLYVVLKTGLSGKTIEDVLGSISANQSLNDMVSQHFFKGTPAHFAFGYFENFRDYQYPLGGTGQLPKALTRKIVMEGGDIRKNAEITHVDPWNNQLTDRNGKKYAYDLLLWTADLKSLYRNIDERRCPPKLQNSIRREQRKYESANAGESVFSLFLAVDENPEAFRKISRGHFIYTPRQRGLGETHRKQLDRIKSGFSGISKHKLFQWLREFCTYNSYEISIPVLKDRSLAPESRTGLIISLLFDGKLLELVEQAGWYDEFRERTADYMLDILERTIYPGLIEKVLFRESATPVTLMRMFNTSGGAITGWSLEEKPPVPDSLLGITATVKTAIPHVYKAGQWSYSPSGVPIAILTGKIAANAVGKAAGRL